jgi:SAM-dependent methyltransferase
MRCKICGNESGNTTYLVREMMFGLREVFDYSACAGCGCLQLDSIPCDMSKYYPSNYYAFEKNEIFAEQRLDNPCIRFLRKARTSYMLTDRGFIGKLLAVYHPAQEKLSEYIGILKHCQANLGSEIVDVGCGSGKLIAELAWYGFKNVSGVDLYAPDIELPLAGVRMYKGDVFSLGGQFDIVLLNHSFEHMPEPLAVLQHIEKILKDTASAIIRIPIASSYAWQHYRSNWVQIDAPRHLFLHSLKSIELLVSKTNLKIREIVFDSTEFQFWGSQQYQRDIPLWDERSFRVDPKKSIFADKDIKEFKEKAKKLNQQKMGDQACIFLAKN